MRFSFKYASQSQISGNNRSTQMSFAPDTFRDPTFFVGELGKKIPFREAMSALHDVVVETGSLGYQTIATYHGAPASCDDHHGHKIACCIHGMPTFPFWHRAYVVQMERALLAKRDVVGIPYWDWTEPMTHLPEMVSHPIYVDSHSGKVRMVVFSSLDVLHISHK